MRIRVCLLAAAAVWAPVWGQWREAKPEENPATFRAGVSLVRVDVEVAEGYRALTGLRKEDFVVRDNGAVQSILNFGREEVPLDLVLLFDVSGSMRPAAEQVADVASEAFRELRDGDRVAVACFTTRTEWLQPFTTNLDEVQEAIVKEVLGQPFSGGTAIHAGVRAAAERLREASRGSARRRAILVITDNKGMFYRAEPELIEFLWETDAVVSALVIDASDSVYGPGGGAGSTPPVIFGRRFPRPAGGGSLTLGRGIDRVVEETGGAMVKAALVSADFPAIMQRLRNRYSLYYAMPKGAAGERRRVAIELTGEAQRRHREARISARKGYVLPDRGLEN